MPVPRVPRPMSGRALGNVKVYTMQGPFETADAIAWTDGKIVALGRKDVEAAAADHGLQLEDGGGRCVIPGLVDAHMHFLHVGVRAMRPDLRGATGKADCAERTLAWIDLNPGPGAIIAEGWDESGWDDTAFPTREELDSVCPDRPLVWRRQCGHIAVGNSRALPMVRAIWDEDELVDMGSGLIQEAPSLYLNEALPVSDEDLDKALEIAMDVAHEEGVTAIGEYAQAPFRNAYLRAARDDRLRVRIACSIYVQQLDDAIRDGFTTGTRHSPWLQDGGLKVFLDGSFGGRTAYLREPYKDDPEAGHGTPIWTDDQLDTLFGKAHDAGIQVHAHAIGDAAIDQGLDAYERLAASRQQAPASAADVARGTEDGAGVDGFCAPLRHRFEHYELPHDDAIERTRRLGVVPCAQPNFVGVWSREGGMYERRIGPVFALNNRYRTFLDRDVDLCFGSDGMPFGPRVGLQAALDHPVEAERLSIEEAVWLYTARAAYGIHWEQEIGTLAPGMRADLVVLDQHQLDARAPTDWTFHEVIADGRTVHAKGDARPATGADAAVAAGQTRA